MFCLNLMRIALELAKENPVYEGLATKFFQHYAYVAARDEAHGQPRLSALGRAGRLLLRRAALPGRRYHKFRVRSLVGLIPLFAVERLELDWIEPFQDFKANLALVPQEPAGPGRPTSSIPYEHEGRHARASAHDRRPRPARTHARAGLGPRRIPLATTASAASRRPTSGSPSCSTAGSSATSRPRPISKLKGGNSNWRGPIWFPTTFLLIESLRKLGKALRATIARCDCRRAAERPVTFRDHGPRPRRPADQRSSRGTSTAGGRSSASVRSSRTTRTGATICCSTSTSTATTAPASAPPTRPAGPPWSPA